MSSRDLFASAEIQACIDIPDFLHVCWASELRPSYLHSLLSRLPAPGTLLGTILAPAFAYGEGLVLTK